MPEILKSELNSYPKFKAKLGEYIQNLKEYIVKVSGIEFNIEEICRLVLSICRSNDFNVISTQGNKMFLNEENVFSWVKEKLIPNTITVKLDDEDIIRLLIFCIEITYQMFSGGTRATISQKGSREQRRTFDKIIVDQFNGKFGEIVVKKFLERNFPTKIELDWEISTKIEKYRNDIVNANKNVSIKSSPSIAGVWAGADIGYDYGINVKCFIPQPLILQFFIEVCGFTRLLDFAEGKIPSSNGRFKGYLEEMRKRIKAYKCGEIQTTLKGFVSGYFKTLEYTPIEKGVKLPYLGKVNEETYLVPINELRYTPDDWTKLLRECNLL